MSEFSESDRKALEQLGFDRWFQDQSEPFLKEGLSVARILEVHRNSYKVCAGQHNAKAKLSGRFKFHSQRSVDYPAVGDWVVLRQAGKTSPAIIHDVVPRKSLLKRKEPGRTVAFQAIAANIDAAFVIQSVDSNFDLNRLERYLVMIHESEIRPVVVLSKTDLISADELSEIHDKIERFRSKYLFLPISNVTGDGIDALRDELKANHTYCLLGSSGVGKTTLLNTLLGERLFEVADVREKDRKGRHTTTKRHLIRLESGPLFIDTPGMRELGNFAIDTGLDETFDDIAAYSRQCRFNDCSHTHEKDCAVRAAVEQGLLDEASYQNFIKIQAESAFYDRSLVGRKKKAKGLSRVRKRYSKSRKKP